MVQQIKRDREEEMIHRGTEYARAIKKFYKKNGRYPATLDDLDKGQIRYSAQALQRSAHQRRQVEAAELRRHRDVAERGCAGHTGCCTGVARWHIDSWRRAFNACDRRVGISALRATWLFCCSNCSNS